MCFFAIGIEHPLDGRRMARAGRAYLVPGPKTAGITLSRSPCHRWRSWASPTMLDGVDIRLFS
jgi:hypothetical protein